MSKTIRIRHTEKDVVDVGTFKTSSGHDFHLVLGSIHDAGAIDPETKKALPQPEQDVPAEVWREAKKNKAVAHMLETGKIVEYG
jgi:hypothetical protein